MKITIVTLFPKMIKGFIDESILKRAQKNKLAKIDLINLRDFALDSYKTVDGRPYGGGAGMVLRADVIHRALASIADFQSAKTILTSPQGKIFNQQKAVEYSKLNHLVIIAGHYEGVDERVRKFVDEEVSLGDFVMTGGEIAATAIIDAVVRLLPGVLKKEEAIKKESFFKISVDRLIEVVGADKILKKLKEKGIKTVRLLEYPQYTRPEEFQGRYVPSILLSGNHERIEKWRIKTAYQKTIKRRRFDLLTD